MTLTYSDMDAEVKKHYLPHLIDQVFQSNPLLTRLMSKSKVEVKGGRNIDQPVLYGKHAFGSYLGSDAFDIAYKPKKTLAQWDWKFVYSNITLTGTDRAIADSDEKIIDQLDSEMQGCSLTVNDGLSTMFFGDGTGNTLKDFDGLLNAVDDGTSYDSYGGISRATNSWWNAYVDATGGAVLLDTVNAAIGHVTVNEKKPDLGITTQAIYDKLWSRIQPSQRSLGDKHQDIANVGFTGVNFNGHCAITVDSHCPAGSLFLLNTEYWKLIINRNKNFEWTPAKTPVDADMYVRQLLLGGNLICIAPRYQAQLTGLI